MPRTKLDFSFFKPASLPVSPIFLNGDTIHLVVQAKHLRSFPVCSLFYVPAWPIDKSQKCWIPALLAIHTAISMVQAMLLLFGLCCNGLLNYLPAPVLSPTVYSPYGTRWNALPLVFIHLHFIDEETSRKWLTYCKSYKCTDGRWTRIQFSIALK